MNKNKIMKIIKKILPSLIIIFGALVLEIFIFNYRFYVSRGEVITFQISDYTKSLVLAEDGLYYANTDNPTIYIENINQELKSIYLDIERARNETFINYCIYYTDETRPNLTAASKKFQIINDFDQSKYAELEFFGESSSIYIQIEAKKEDAFRLGEITFNKKIPFYFSITRFLLILLISFTIYAFFLLYKYEEKIQKLRHLDLILKTTMSLLSVATILFFFGYVYVQFDNYAILKNGTQISQELVEMFKAFRVSLLETPSEALKALTNPYNPSARAGIDYLWDHLYFKGKYYSYYGVTPVFLLFLPVNLLTGGYLYDGYGVLIFSLIGVVFMTLAYFNLVKKYFDKLPVYITVLGYIMLFMTSGVLTNISRPAFYEVSTSSGYMCMMLFLFFFTKSGVLFKNEDFKPCNIALASLFMGLAVLSRATLALYAIPFVLWSVIRIILEWKKLTRRNRIVNLVTLFLPIGILAAFQCSYNYLRFGSIFDFGIEYSLTINDFTNTKIKPGLVFNSLYNFLLAIPNYDAQNYFIHGNALNFSNGYYFFESYDAIGLFFRMPLILLIFVLPFKNNLEHRDRFIFFLKYYIPLFIIPLIIVMITWESGFAIRYFSDFAWAMSLFGLFTFFYYYKRYNGNKELSKLLSVLLIIIMFHTCITSIAHVLNYIPFEGRQIGVNLGYANKRYYRIARELAFWS